MRIKLFESFHIKRGTVRVEEDGKVVADGAMDALQLVDDGIPDVDVAEIYVYASDAATARLRLITEGRVQ
jgi:hypothetical protein